MEKFGIESLKKFGTAVMDIFDLADDVWADKKINFADAIHAPRFISIAPAIASSALRVVPEATNLSAEEQAELKAYFKDYAKKLKADPEPDWVEAVGEKVLSTVIDLAAGASVWKNK